MELIPGLVRKADFRRFYRVENEAFASGFSSSVRRCYKNGSSYAAKITKMKEAYNEIALLSSFKSEYLIKFIDAFVYNGDIVTIMEFAPGGDLQSVIDADLVLLEKDVKKFMRQLLLGLEYLHCKDIAHLDVKPQNLLLMGQFPNCNIKLCDFELSKKVDAEIREIVGTPDYVAPEILQFKRLTTKSDLWSTGITTYVLITGFSPFGGDTDPLTFKNILQEEVDFPSELFDDVSFECIQIISLFLRKDTRLSLKLKVNSLEVEDYSLFFFRKRISATEALAHDWFFQPRRGHSPQRSSGRKKSLLRASKSEYNINENLTKSRELLLEKMLKSGSRKNLSKSREQLWLSKMHLDKPPTPDPIMENNTNCTNLRWASVASFPSLETEETSSRENADDELSEEEKKSVSDLIKTFSGKLNLKNDFEVIEEEIDLKVCEGAVGRARGRFEPK